MGNGYVPGMQGLSFGLNLNKDIKKEQEAQRKSAKGIGKWGSKKGILAMVGSQIFDKFGSKALTTMLAPTLGPLAPFVAKAITKGGGHLLGQTLAGKGPEVKGGGTGLLGSGLSKLDELKGGINKSLQGDALGMASSAFSGEAWKDYTGGLLAKGPLNIMKGLGFGADVPKGLEGMGDIVSQARESSEILGNPYSFNEGGYTGPSLESGQYLSEEGILSQSMGIPEGLLEGLRGRDKKPKYGRSNPSSYIDDFLTARDSKEKALAELGGMKHADSAREFEDIYQKSLQGFNRMGDLANLEQMKQAIGQSISASPIEYMSKEFDGSNQPESLPPMMNPFTGGELSGLRATDLPQGLQKLIPEGEYKGDEWLSSIPEEGMQQYLQGQVGNPYQNILEMLGEKMPKEQWAIGGEGGVNPERVQSKNKDNNRKFAFTHKGEPVDSHFTWKGEKVDLSELIGNLFKKYPKEQNEGGVNPEYVQEQRAKLGLQMGGMPGVSSPIPYQEGGSSSKKDDRLSNLLSMILGKNKRQKAYDDMVPQDMIEDAHTADVKYFKIPKQFLSTGIDPSYPEGVTEIVSPYRNTHIPSFPQDFIDVGLPDMRGGTMSWKEMFEDPENLPLYMQGYQGGGGVEKEGLLAGLLSMLSGANKKQKAYKELAPKDMIESALTADAIVKKLNPAFASYFPEGTTEFVSSERDMPMPAQVQDFIDVGLPDRFGGKMSWKEMLAEPETLPRYMQGYQDGGYLRQYNLGGSVAQQPMSYQLGGLLKYKRNPMVG